MVSRTIAPIVLCLLIDVIAIGSVGCFLEAMDKRTISFKVSGNPPEQGKTKEWNCMRDTSVDVNCTSRRAWCFQETLLSPRSIYFERSQLYWRCRTYDANESFPRGIDHPYKPLKATVTQHNMGLEDSLDVWADLIEQYSKGSLTRWSDRLVALTGIAELFGERIALPERDTQGSDTREQNYLAGLWRPNLEIFMLWYSVAPDKRRQLLSFPSWSWASCCGEVCLPRLWGGDYSTAITVLDANTTLESENPFGSVSSGILRLRCNAPVRVKLEYAEDSRKHSIYLENFESYIWVYFDLKSSEDEEAFLVHGYTMRHKFDVEQLRHRGLLLQQTAIDGTFRRVGIYQFFSRVGKYCELSPEGQLELKDEFSARSFLFERQDDQQIISIE
jgi:hypothetical protein